MRKVYKVTLKALSPIFIGSGETLRKSQYLFNKNTQQATIIKEDALVQALIKYGKLKAFIEIIKTSNVPLVRILKELGITQHQYLEHYTLKINGFANTDREQLNDLNTIIRDGTGSVYIPGSSIKGALRTCLLKNMGVSNIDFNKLSISDSSVVPNSQLAIYQKVDFSKKLGTLRVYRECIAPGTEVTFNITLIDSAIDIDSLLDSIQYTYETYHNGWATPLINAREQDLNKYDFFDNYHNPKDVKEDDRFIMYLGGGAGFVSKTLHYKTKNRDTAKYDVFKILKNNFSIYRKFKGVPNHVPMALKLAKNNHKLMEMGKCELFFDEI